MLDTVLFIRDTAVNKSIVLTSQSLYMGGRNTMKKNKYLI